MTDVKQRIEEIQTDLEVLKEFYKQEMYKIMFIPKHMLLNRR